MIYLRMEPSDVISSDWTLTLFMQIQTLAISPLILMVLGIAIINQRLRLKGLKHLLNWADLTQYNTQLRMGWFHGMSLKQKSKKS